MRYEVSERIRTDRPAKDVLNLALAQFKKISGSAKAKNNDTIIAKSIEASFGSGNRADKVIVTVHEAEDGWLMIGQASYRPSFFFWIIECFLIFTFIGWIFPIVFYLTQKKSVKEAIENCFHRVANELNTSRPLGMQAAVAAPQLSKIEEIEKLASLKERGHITDEEFASQKLALLRR